MDKYERLEAWIEKQLDATFLWEGQQFSWNILNREIEENIDRPMAAKGLLKQAILSLWNRERKEAEERGLSTSHLEGLREYGERKIFPGTKRERSWINLFERLEWTDPEGISHTSLDIFDEFERRIGQKRAETRIGEEKERLEDTEFRRIESAIQRATPDELKPLLGSIKKAPFTKKEKDFLKRLIIVEKTETLEFRDFIEGITTGISEAGAPEDLANELEKIKIIPDVILKTNLERQWAQKKIDLGGVVQVGTRERLFGDYDKKMKEAMEEYNADEEFISRLTERSLSAFGFSEEEIAMIKEFKGRVPKIELVKPKRPTIT